MMLLVLIRIIVFALYYTIQVCLSFFPFFVCLFVYQDRVSLCSSNCPGTHSVDQAGLELRNPPASVSASAGIKGVCHHRPHSRQIFEFEASLVYRVSFRTARATQRNPVAKNQTKTKQKKNSQVV